MIAMPSADELPASLSKLPAEQRHRIARELVISLDKADNGAEAAMVTRRPNSRPPLFIL